MLRRRIEILAIFVLLTCSEFATAAVVVQDASAEEVGGATIQNLNPALAQELNFAPNMPGVVVMAVDPSSPASKAGLLPGDVITTVNNTPVQSTSELKDTIWWQGVNPVTFLVIRGGQNYVFTFPVW